MPEFNETNCAQDKHIISKIRMRSKGKDIFSQEKSMILRVPNHIVEKIPGKNFEPTVLKFI